MNQRTLIASIRSQANLRVVWLCSATLAVGLLQQDTAQAVTVVFDTAGPHSWYCPNGVTNITVECWGGGGAGGAASVILPAFPNSNAGGGGGAGGAYARKQNVPVTPFNSYNFEIALAAENPAGADEGVRVNGGSTTFTGDIDVTVTAAGGEGGASMVVTNNATFLSGAPGLGSTNGCIGDIVFSGGDGENRNDGNATAGGGGAGDSANGENGGSIGNYQGGEGGINGGGRGGNGRSGVNNGFPGITPGGGGGGAKARQQNPQYSGGQGGLGKVKLTYISTAIPSYYSAGNSDPTSTSSWWTGTDGTGSHPADFSSGNFFIQNGHNMTMSSNWDLSSGDGLTGVIVQSGGTLTCGTNVVSGYVNFTLESGATLSIGSLDGITTSGGAGNIQTYASISFSTSANYIYTGGSTQVTGDGLPAIVHNFTAQAPVKMSKAITVLGTETLGVAGDATTAILDLDTFPHTVYGLQTAGTGTNQVIGSSATGGNPKLFYKGATAGSFEGVIVDSLIGDTNQTVDVTVEAIGGELTLSGPSTYVGGTTVTAGQLNINYGGSSSSNSAIGTGPIAITSGALGNTSGGPITLLPNNPVAFANKAGAGGTLTFNGPDDLNLGTGPGTFYITTPTRTNYFLLNGTGLTLTLGGDISCVNPANSPSCTWEVNGAGNTLVLGSLALNSISNVMNSIWQGSGNVTINNGVSPGTGDTNQHLTYAGSGTLTIGGPCTYGGATTIRSGTLALGSGGSLGVTTNLTILAGGTLDVSAQSSPYTVPTELNASGAALPARIVGPAAGAVDLGTQPVSLTFDGSNPALTVTGATTLAVNGNLISVNNTGSALSGGTYHLIQLGDGSGSGITGTMPVLNGGVVGGSGVVEGATLDLAVNDGYVDLVVTTSGSSTPGNPQNVQVVDGNLIFSVTNSSGSYRIQGNTNLANGAGWVDIATNAAPFSFTNSADLPQRFFRTVTP